MSDASRLHEDLKAEIETVLVGNEVAVELLTVALLSRGHVLLEGPPGVAKTTIANLFARGLGLDYRRIQLTPDLLPADITGTHIYREGVGEFELHRGPVFSNVVVADEINRAPPKTQSALLEAMQELQVTIEGETLELPQPFILIATQNPIEMEGVFDLPQAQRDRFLFKVGVDLLEEADELALLDHFDAEPLLEPESVDPVVSMEDVWAARDAVEDVYIDDGVQQYIVELAKATRTHENVALGASTRASIHLQLAAKARAAIKDRQYVIPDDVKFLVGPLLRHRLVLTTEAELGDVDVEELIEEAVGSITPPGVVVEPDDGVA